MTIDLPADSALRSPDFLFGVATSSYQIEGAADSRLPCIWDTFCDEPGRIADGSNGRVACDHVRFWREDVALMADLGVDAYRFSISWPRVLTENGALDPDGVGFYRDLVEGLLKEGIKPFATLYHWDLPQYLEDRGGWLNRDTAYRFRDYAALISEALRLHRSEIGHIPLHQAGIAWGVRKGANVVLRSDDSLEFKWVTLD